MYGVSGIEENTSQMIAWPNPCNNSLSITTEGIQKPVRYVITNMMGQIVDRGETKITENQAIINTSSLKNGVYILSFGEQKNIRFGVQH
jgi:hypothetical protein